MITTDSSFSVTRVRLFLVKHCSEHTKRLLSLAGSILLMPTLFIILIVLLDNTYSRTSIAGFDGMWHAEFIFFSFFYVCGVLIPSASEFFNAYGDKNKRFSLLTLPASQAEQYTVYFLLYIVGFALLGIVSLILADAVRVWVFSPWASPNAYINYMPVRYLFYNMDGFFGTDNYFRYLCSEPVDFSIKGVIVMILLALTLQAQFVVGSSLWPKNSFLKTALAGCAVSMAGQTLVILVFFLFVHNSSTLRPWVETFSDHSAFVTILISQVLMIVFCYWFAYRRFRELEIINRW